MKALTHKYNILIKPSFHSFCFFWVAARDNPSDMTCLFHVHGRVIDKIAVNKQKRGSRISFFPLPLLYSYKMIGAVLYLPLPVLIWRAVCRKDNMVSFVAVVFQAIVFFWRQHARP